MAEYKENAAERDLLGQLLKYRNDLNAAEKAISDIQDELRKISLETFPKGSYRRMFLVLGYLNGTLIVLLLLFIIVALAYG